MRSAETTFGTEVPAELRTQIHGALASLYQPGALAAHPLAGLAWEHRPAGAASPARALQRALLDAVEELRPEQGWPESRAARHHEILQLRYVEGLSYQEISEVVGCPVNTVKTRMFHARRRLRDLLPGMGVSSHVG